MCRKGYIGRNIPHHTLAKCFVLYILHALFTVVVSANLAQIFSLEEVAHVLLPRAGVIDSYVVQVSALLVSFATYYCNTNRFARFLAATVGG
jgi:hypothetical protein